MACKLERTLSGGLLVSGDSTDPTVNMSYSGIQLKFVSSQTFKGKGSLERVAEERTTCNRLESVSREIPFPYNQDFINIRSSVSHVGDGYLQTTGDLLNNTEGTLYSVNCKGIHGSDKASFQWRQLDQNDGVYLTMKSSSHAASDQPAEQGRFLCLIHVDNALAMKELSGDPNNRTDIPANAGFICERYGYFRAPQTWAYRFRIKNLNSHTQLPVYITCHGNGEVDLAKDSSIDLNDRNNAQHWPNDMTFFSINSQVSEERVEVDTVDGTHNEPVFKRARLAYCRSVSSSLGADVLL